MFNKDFICIFALHLQYKSIMNKYSNRYTNITKSSPRFIMKILSELLKRVESSDLLNRSVRCKYISTIILKGEDYKYNYNSICSVNKIMKHIGINATQTKYGRSTSVVSKEPVLEYEWTMTRV